MLVAAAALWLSACGSDDTDPPATNPDAAVTNPDATSGLPDAAEEADAGEEADATTGEPDASEEADAGEATATWSEVQAIMSARCAGCHDGRQGRLDITDPTELIDVQAEDVPIDLIEPGSPETSFLYLKVTGQQAMACTNAGIATRNCGSRMPPQASQLTAAQRELIFNWITAGAIVD